MNKITCENCGACCKEMCSPPFIPGDSDEGELAQLPDAVRKDYELGMKFRDVFGWSDDVPCFWLTEDLKCKHYQYRPEICRKFKVGGRACRTWRKLFGETG